MNKPPAFQFYADDFLGGVGDMTCEEVGAYIRLLCHQWNKGGLVNDDDRLQIMAGQCQASALATAKTKFGVCGDGLLRNARLELERSKQTAYREKQAENGAKRWGSDAKPNAKPNAKPVPSHMPNGCPPSPSPSPSSNNTNTRRSAPVVVFPPLLDNPEFREAWAAWERFRSEAKKPLTQTTVDQQLKTLAGFGVGGAIKSIEQSIGSSWSGLFPPGPATMQSNQSKRRMIAV